MCCAVLCCATLFVPDCPAGRTTVGCPAKLPPFGHLAQLPLPTCSLMCTPESSICVQVRDLMIFLEARQTIEAAGGASELEGASVLPIPEQQQQQAGGAGRGRGGGRRGKRR